MSESELGRLFLSGAISVFEKHKLWADQAIVQLSVEKLRQVLDENTNSIAVIMKHVSGNLLSRWTDFLTTDGEKPWRDRDQEFIENFPSRRELENYWEQGWKCLFGTLAGLTPADLARTITIRGEPHSVPLAIQRSLAHCSYHVGQILMLARHWAGEDWKTITIPRGKSSLFNQKVWGTDNDSHLEKPTDGSD